jgi:hypothetical protein
MLEFGMEVLITPTITWLILPVKEKILGLETTKLLMMTFACYCAYYLFLSSSHAKYCMKHSFLFSATKDFQPFPFCNHVSLCPKAYHISALPFLSKYTLKISMMSVCAVPMLS